MLAGTGRCLRESLKNLTPRRGGLIGVATTLDGVRRFADPIRAVPLRTEGDRTPRSVWGDGL